MTAIVAEGKHRKVFLSPTEVHIQATEAAEPTWRPRGKLPEQARSISVQLYGFTEWHKLFTDRQISALNTFGNLLFEVRSQIIKDGAEAKYAEVLQTYFALAIGRTTDGNSSFTVWNNSGMKIEGVFARQGIPMTWDFAEANPFSSSTQNWMGQVRWIAKTIENLPFSLNNGEVYQADATTTIHATDRPCYCH